MPEVIFLKNSFYYQKILILSFKLVLIWKLSETLSKARKNASGIIITLGPAYTQTTCTIKKHFYVTAGPSLILIVISLLNKIWFWNSSRPKTIKERIRFCEKYASFEIAALFPLSCKWEKRAAISKQTCFSPKRVRSYIV